MAEATITPLRDLVPGIVRTVVPIAASQIIALLAALGIILPEDASQGLAQFLGGLIGALLYILIRIIERKLPQIGILLGYIKVPVYVDPTKTVDEQRPELREAVNAAAKTPDVPPATYSERGQSAYNLVWTVVGILVIVVLLVWLL